MDSRSPVPSSDPFDTMAKERDDLSLQAPATESNEEERNKEENIEEVLSVLSMETLACEAGALQTLMRSLAYAFINPAVTQPVDSHTTRLNFGKTTESMSFYDKHYKGLKQNIASNSVRAAVLFGGMAAFKDFFQKNLPPELRPLADLFAFITASTIEGIVMTPNSLANLRMRLNDDVKTFRQALSFRNYPHTLKAMGRGAFWGGACGFAFSGPFYYLLKKGEAKLIHPDDSHSTRILKMVLAGGLAGFIPSLFCHPLKMIQQKTMEHTDLSTLQILRKMGFKEPFKGISYAPIRVTLASAALGGSWFGVDTLWHKFSGFWDSLQTPGNKSFFNQSSSSLFRQARREWIDDKPMEENEKENYLLSMMRPG